MWSPEAEGHSWSESLSADFGQSMQVKICPGSKKSFDCFCIPLEFILCVKLLALILSVMVRVLIPYTIKSWAAFEVIMIFYFLSFLLVVFKFSHFLISRKWTV